MKAEWKRRLDASGNGGSQVAVKVLPLFLRGVTRVLEVVVERVNLQLTRGSFLLLVTVPSGVRFGEGHLPNAQDVQTKEFKSVIQAREGSFSPVRPPKRGQKRSVNLKPRNLQRTNFRPEVLHQQKGRLQLPDRALTPITPEFGEERKLPRKGSEKAPQH